MRYSVLLVLASGCGFSHGELSSTPAHDAAAADDATADASSDLDALADAPADVELTAEAENATTITARGTHAWTLVTDVPGTSGTGAMQVLPNNGTPCTLNITTTCSELQYAFSVPRGDTYYVHARLRSTNTADDSVWVGVDGTPEPNPVQPTADSTWRWTTAGTAFALTAGMHTVSVWYRETGIRFDVVALSTKMAPPP